MSEKYRKCICVFVVAIIILSFFSFVNFLSLINRNWLISFSLAMYLLLAISFFGFQKNKLNNFKKGTIKILLIILTVEMISLLIMSKVTNFNDIFIFLQNNYVSITFLVINSIIFELLRYIFISNNKNNKIIIVFLMIPLTILSFITESYLFSMNELNYIQIISLFIIPHILENVILTYLSYKIGYKISIIFKLFNILSEYLLFYVFNINLYLYAFISYFSLYIVYKVISNMFAYYDKELVHDFNTKWFRSYDFVALAIVLFFLYLIFGNGSIYMLGVSSDSMSPILEVGDAIVMKKVNSNEDIDIEDIVAYVEDGQIIVHRIVEVNTNEKGEIIYHTKGDFNQKMDNIDLTIDDIDGKMIFNIPYLASASVKSNKVRGD